MLSLAGEWGWVGNDTINDLDKLLKRMIDESNPDLSFGFIKLDEVGSYFFILLFFIFPCDIMFCDGWMDGCNR